MARKDALMSMRQILVKRRDALRKALAGDLSLLKELRAQTAGDLVDAAWIQRKTKLVRNWRKSKAVNWRMSRTPWSGCEPATTVCARVALLKSPWPDSTHCPTQLIAFNVLEKPKSTVRLAATIKIGAASANRAVANRKPRWTTLRLTSLKAS